MLQFYGKWNQWVTKALWILVVIGLIASIPLIVNRVEMEDSSDQVEFVFDDRNIVESESIADHRLNHSTSLIIIE